MTDLERGISLLWVVDSYWRTISTTHMGLSAGLVRGDSAIVNNSTELQMIYSDSESELTTDPAKVRGCTREARRLRMAASKSSSSDESSSSDMSSNTFIDGSDLSTVARARVRVGAVAAEASHLILGCTPLRGPHSFRS